MTPGSREQPRGPIKNIGHPKPACPHPPLQAFDAALQQWLEQRCLFHERHRGGVASLHLDYVVWCAQALEVPCSLSSFQDWFVLQGFQLSSFNMVQGIVLKVDLWEQRAAHL